MLQRQSLGCLSWGQSVRENRVFCARGLQQSWGKQATIPAHNQVRRAGRTRYWQWELVVNQLWLLIRLQLYYFFWYKGEDGPIVILSKHWKKDSNMFCTHSKKRPKVKTFPSLAQLNRDSHAEEQVLDRPNQPQDTFYVVTFYFHLPGDWSAMCQTECHLPGHRTL